MSVGSGTVRLSHQNRNVAGTPLDEGVGNTLVSDLWFKHLDAAAQLQYARITKTAVLCAGRFWPEPESGGYSVRTNLASDFCFDSTFGQKGAKRILCSYAVGDQAVDIASSPQDKLKYWIVEDVANANGLNWSANYSKTIALDMQQQAWQADPFTRGAYAFRANGSPSATRFANDSVASFSRASTSPTGRVSWKAPFKPATPPRRLC